VEFADLGAIQDALNGRRAGLEMEVDLGALLRG
jgi:hypothetical protein